jgi:hypothetical protein
MLLNKCEVGRTYTWVNKKCIKNFDLKTLWGEITWRTCVHMKLTLQFILSWWVNVWTTWGRGQWWALVNVLMDIQVSGNLKSWPDDQLLSTQGQTLQYLYGYNHFRVEQKNLFVHWKLKSVSRETTDCFQKQYTYSCHGVIKLPESERCVLIPKTCDVALVLNVFVFTSDLRRAILSTVQWK